MRVIHLTHGAGNGINKACLLTASNMLIGRGEDGDRNSCVCPVIRAFIVVTNDAMPEELLGELYGPLVWEILGTNTNDPEIERQRAFAFADWAVREVVPLALDAACGIAHTLRSVAAIVDGKSAYAAADAAHAAERAAHAAADAERAAADAAHAAHAAHAAADAAADAAHAAERAAHAAARAAADAAHAAERAAADAAERAAADDAAHAAARAAERAAANAATIWRMCPEIIRRVVAIGDKRPVECVLSADELAEALA